MAVNFFYPASQPLWSDEGGDDDRDSELSASSDGSDSDTHLTGTRTYGACDLFEEVFEIRREARIDSLVRLYKGRYKRLRYSVEQKAVEQGVCVPLPFANTTKRKFLSPLTAAEDYVPPQGPIQQYIRNVMASRPSKAPKRERKSAQYDLTHRDRELKQTERDIFVQKLLLFGFNRWETIYKQTGTRRIVRELRHYGFMFARVLREYVTEPEDADFLDLLLAQAPPLKKRIDHSLLDWKKPASHGTAWTRRLRLLYRLVHTVESVPYEKLMEDVARMVPGPLPADWWRPVLDDRDLLIGIYKHGYGAYEKVRSDPSLCFANRISPSANGGDLVHDNFEEDLTDDDEDRNPSSKSANMQWEDQDKDPDWMMVDRIEPGDRDDAFNPPRLANTLGSGSSKSATSRNNGGGLLLWPSADALTKRLKRLLKNVDGGERHLQLMFHQHQQQQEAERARKQVEANERARQERAQSYAQRVPESKRGRVAAEKAEQKAYQWSKREKAEFLRQLLIYGVLYLSPPPASPPLYVSRSLEPDDWPRHDWSVIRERAGIAPEKRSDLLEDQFRELMEQADALIAKDKAGDDDGQEEKPTKDNKDGTLTNTSARKLRERVIMLDAIRMLVLPFPNLLAVLTKGHCVEHGGQCGRDLCPVWWVTGKHDLGLLQGVERHGWGFWDLINSDLSLPFFETERELRNDFARRQLQGSSVQQSPYIPRTFVMEYPEPRWYTRRIKFLVHLVAPARYPCPFKFSATTSSRGDAKAPQNQQYAIPAVAPLPAQLVQQQAAQAQAAQMNLPVQLKDGLSLFRVGSLVTDRPGYRTDQCIYPVGYKAVREFPSMKNGQMVNYICEIVDGGPRPRFKVTPTDDPVNTVIRDSAFLCWQAIASLVRKRFPEVAASVLERATDGDGMFGLQASRQYLRVLEETAALTASSASATTITSFTAPVPFVAKKQQGAINTSSTHHSFGAAVNPASNPVKSPSYHDRNPQQTSKLPPPPNPGPSHGSGTSLASTPATHSPMMSSQLARRAPLHDIPSMPTLSLAGSVSEDVSGGWEDVTGDGFPSSSLPSTPLHPAPSHAQPLPQHHQSSSQYTLTTNVTPRRPASATSSSPGISPSSHVPLQEKLSMLNKKLYGGGVSVSLPPSPSSHLPPPPSRTPSAMSMLPPSPLQSPSASK